MNEGEIRDLLPLYARGEASPEEVRMVEAAVAADTDLAAELEFFRDLLSARPEPPLGLADRIVAGLGAGHRQGDGEAEGAPGRQAGGARRDHRAARPGRSGGRPMPRWWLSAAATAILAIGGSLVWTMGRGDGPGLETVPEVAYAAGSEVWPSDDGTVAGEAVLGDLTEEQLERLLAEMTGGVQ